VDFYIYFTFSHIVVFLYLCGDGLIADCSKMELETLFCELMSDVESGSLFSSALVFSIKLL